MENRKKLILDYLHNYDGLAENLNTAYIAKQLRLQRTYVSTILNELVKDRYLSKSEGRPVIYRLTDSFDNEAKWAGFKHFIGSDETLKTQIQQMKAAIMYPKRQHLFLIIGNHGTRKKEFISLIAQLARHSQVEAPESELVEINCMKYERLAETELISQLKEDFSRLSATATVWLNHFEVVPRHLIEEIKVIANEYLQASYLICSITSSDRYLEKYFDLTVSLPDYSEYTLNERVQTVISIVNKQVITLNRKIQFDSLIMRCFLDYRPEFNFESLEKDIVMSCANAYRRSVEIEQEEELVIYISDLPDKVRQGMLLSANNNNSLQSFPPNKQIICEGDKYSLKEAHMPRKKNDKFSIAHTLQEIIEDLKLQGVDDQEISHYISIDFFFYLQQYIDSVSSDLNDEMKLRRYVGKKIMDLTKELLDRASIKLNRIYSQQTYSGFCVFLFEISKRKRIHYPVSKKTIDEVKEFCQPEFELAGVFQDELEKRWHIEISEQESVIMAIFLLDTYLRKYKIQKKLPILVVMHGEGVASNLCESISQMVANSNLDYYEVKLGDNNVDTYHKYREKLLSIADKQGVLVFYDFASIKEMSQLISRETNIPIKMIELPSSLFIIEAIKKSAVQNDLNSLYQSTVQTYQQYFPMLERKYSPNKKKFSIITLCKQGDVEAIQLQGYVQKRIWLPEEVSVIPIDTDDKEFLLSEVDEINKTSQILCIIGTYNPRFVNIPFISMAKFLTIPKDKLNFFLYFGDLPIKDTKRSYESIARFLTEETSVVDIPKLKSAVDLFFSDKWVETFSPDIEAELATFLFIGLLIEGKILQHENAREEVALLAANKKIYNSLLDFAAVIEREQYFKLTDGDLAKVVQIIKSK